MAYVNRLSRQQLAPIIVATVALHTGLIYALVNGFAGGIPAIFKQPRLIGTQIKLPPPPPTERVKDQKVRPNPRPSTSAPSGYTQSVVDTFTGVEVTDFLGGGGSGEIGTLDPLPLPTPQPQPLVTPKPPALCRHPPAG